VADPGLSEKERKRMEYFCREGILPIPALLEPAYETLYDRVFTCRVDSPRWLIRFLESREYSCQGGRVQPGTCGKRVRGSITIDNKNYGRYSGELQLIRRDLNADSRVNVIGRVPEEAWHLMDLVKGGRKFMLVRP